MIYCSHGVVDSYSENKYCNRNLIDKLKLKAFLDNRTDSFLSLEDAVDGKGDAFTIDDASYASLDAVKLLKQYGHHVTLFVNPCYIEKSLPHWFYILNTLLDSLRLPIVYVRKIKYPSSSYKEKVYLRKVLKDILSVMSSEEDQFDFLNSIFKTDVHAISLPPYLNTLTKSDLHELNNIGVDIQNHGWSHRLLKSVSNDIISYEINSGKKWLKDELNIDSDYYAIPFGFPPHPDGLDISEIKCLFTLDFTSPPGSLGNKIYNRCDVEKLINHG